MSSAWATLAPLLCSVASDPESLSTPWSDALASLRLEHDLQLDDLTVLEVVDDWLGDGASRRVHVDALVTVRDLMGLHAAASAGDAAAAPHTPSPVQPPVAGDGAGIPVGLPSTNPSPPDAGDADASAWFVSFEGKHGLPRKATWPKPAHPSAVLLVCFYHAGGSASFFRPWPSSAGFNPDPERVIQVCAMELPGHGTRTNEACVPSVPVLASRAAHALLHGPLGGAWPLSRVALFGHSFGSLIAFEVTRILHQHYVDRGDDPAAAWPKCVCVSGRRAPQLRAPDPDRGEHVLSSLPSARFVASLLQIYKNPALDRLSQNPSFLEHFLPIIKADMRAFEGYDWRSVDAMLCDPHAADAHTFGCPVWAAGGTEDHMCTEHMLRAWSAHVAAPNEFSMSMFPGGHFYLSEANEFLPALRSHVLGE